MPPAKLPCCPARVACPGSADLSHVSQAQSLRPAAHHSRRRCDPQRHARICAEVTESDETQRGKGGALTVLVEDVRQSPAPCLGVCTRGGRHEVAHVYDQDRRHCFALPALPLICQHPGDEVLDIKTGDAGPADRWREQSRHDRAGLPESDRYGGGPRVSAGRSQHSEDGAALLLQAEPDLLPECL